jgi:hypothetical protein
MNAGWMVVFFALAVGGVRDSHQAVEQVDLIELNHFHDCLGRHVYDQVIFYEWSEEQREYHVRAWCLVEDREAANRRPSQSYSDERFYVRWYDRDQNLNRCIASLYFRESWTQVDPERANKRLLDERQRTSLVKRRLDPQAKESESFEQEAIASEGDLASSDPDEASTVLR